MTAITQFPFMPYGAPELKEVARRYMVRSVGVASSAWILVFLLSFGTSEFLQHRPHEISVVVVPHVEIIPPPLIPVAPLPPINATHPAVLPTAALPVPVPEPVAPPDQTTPSQPDFTQTPPGNSIGEGTKVVVAPPGDPLPGPRDYVPFDELPVAITIVQPVYPDLAREAGVDGTVMVRALIGRDGKVKDALIMKSIAMLDGAAEAAVRQWVFKPALSNNKPVAVWVAVPVKFILH